MALIGKIRKNSLLLILSIGLALAAFILMDMFSGQKSIFGQTQMTVGNIAGKKIDINEFNRLEKIRYQNSDNYYNNRNSLWNYLIEKTLVEQEADALGLGVSSAEVMELQFGNNLSPIIQQRWANPQTRQVDRNQLNQIKAALENGELGKDPNLGPYWREQEFEIIKERLQSKLNTMVSKAMYTPKWMVEQTYLDQNQKVNFAYVKIPFDDIDDAVELTDSDYQSYLKDNAALYKQDEETRRLDYVVFDIKPSKADSISYRTGIADLVNDFKSAEDDSLFVGNNNGTIDEVYFSKKTLSPAIADTLFDVPVGTVYGPYLDGGAYRAVKVLDRKVIPDSVRSRHILINAATQPEYARAYQTIDSLKTLFESGKHSFDSLAIKFSQGPSASKGGDLGFNPPNAMVKPFNDVTFYKAEEDKVYPVITNFGVHLVQVTGRKFIKNETGVKVAYISEPIIPSDETQKNVYDEVLTFTGENRTLESLGKSVDARSDLSIVSSAALKKNDFIVGDLGSGQSSRDMVKWAFSPNTSVGDVSPEIFTFQAQGQFYANKYVVTGLRSIQAAGLPSIANVKNELEPLVRNLKKAGLVKGKVSGKDLNSIAGMYSTKVDTVNGASFASPFAQGLGNEPKVISSSFSMDMNQVSEPIVGNSGVYVVKLTNKTTPPPLSNVPELRKRTSLQAQSQVRGSLIQAMKKNATIKDFRSNFY
ncbi:MAG: SurA N-terminal domain-containing protein [Saprospiraceae bacterium]